MRPDQRERIKDIEEAITEEFIEDADPGGWPEDRKERYVAKRQAMETAQLLMRVQSLLAQADPGGGLEEQHETKADRLIRDASEKATAAVARAMERKGATLGRKG